MHLQYQCLFQIMDVIQNKSKSFQNVMDVMHENRSGFKTYSPPIRLSKNHILNPTLNQEVKGCPGEGNLTGGSWSENGEK